MELNEVKEKYIAQFFELCSEYIDKMEIYQTEIYKLTINRHYEALLKRLKSTTFIDKELDSLYMHFDSIFLSLYPNFPDKFLAVVVYALLLCVILMGPVISTCISVQAPDVLLMLTGVLGVCKRQCRC